MNDKREFVKGVNKALGEFHVSGEIMFVDAWFVDKIKRRNLNREAYFFGKYAVHVFCGNNPIDCMKDVDTERFK